MKIEKSFISCSILKSKFDDHERIKDKILESIDIQEYPPVDYETNIITKSDWNIPQEIFRPYQHYIFPNLADHLKEVYSSLGFAEIQIHNIWFQQYTKGSGHKWHVHQYCQWTNVYYVEMPEGAPFLQLIDPFTNEILDIEVEEGDVLSFPSFIVHRSPNIENDTRKTIIACNSCADISLDYYGDKYP